MSRITLEKILSGNFKSYKVDTGNMNLTIDDLVTIKRIMDRNSESDAEEREKERDDLIKQLVEVLKPFFTKFEDMQIDIDKVKSKSNDHEDRLTIIEGKVENIEKILKVA